VRRTLGDRSALALVSAIAIALRLFGLDRKSVWFDEAITYLDAVTPWAQLLDAVRHDVHPPLSYVVFHLWPWAAAGDFWLRLPSAILGALAAPLAWAWARRVSSPREALLTGVMVAIMPLEVDLAQEARMYGLFLLFTAASLWLLDTLLMQPTWQRMVAYTAVAAAMVYTHYYAAFVLASEGLAVLLAARVHPKGARMALVGLVLAGLSFVPWLPVLLGQARAISGDYWIAAPGVATLWVTFRDLAAHTPPDEPFRLILRAAYVVQAALLVLGLLHAARCVRHRVALCLLGVPIALALAISLFVTPIYVVRYVSPVGLGFAFLLARGVFATGRLAVAAAAVALLPMVLSLWFLYFDPGYSRADLRTAAGLLDAQRQPDEIVLHLSYGTAAPFDYYGSPQPAHVLETESRQELCTALNRHAGGWLVTSYAADDDVARVAAESSLTSPLFAGDLIEGPPIRTLGVSVFRLAARCNV
jgi:uncharacterized membrane protein